MAGPNKAVKAAAERLGELHKRQARAVKKAHEQVARAERLTLAVGAAEQALQDAMATVAARAASPAPPAARTTPVRSPAAHPGAAPTPRRPRRAPTTAAE